MVVLAARVNPLQAWANLTSGPKFVENTWIVGTCYKQEQ